MIDCQLCVGIEKAKIPSDRAVTMDILFKRWMSWYGKKYSQYKLYQGDFLGPEHRATISSSTIVFVNNFAFGPEVDHMLKDRFADLKDVPALCLPNRSVLSIFGSQKETCPTSARSCMCL